MKKNPEKIKINTRRLAKRQRTWFRSFAEVKWLDVMPSQSTEQLAEAAGYNWKFLISDDVNQQSSQIETVIAEGVDIVVLWPHNGDELKSAAQQVVDAGIPIIIYDRLISNFDENVK